MRKRIALGVVLWSATMTAAPLTVYVASDGTGDGSSWESPSKDFTKAFCDCAANAEGGTVYLAGGIYRSTTGNFTVSETVADCGTVCVVGGCDGKETIITGDYGLDDYWSVSGNKIIDSTARVVTLPPVGTYEMYAYSGNCDVSLFDTVTGTGDVTFENLSFTGFKTKLFSANLSGKLCFCDCRFIANGYLNNNTSPLVAVAGGRGVFVDCQFVGNATGVTVSSGNLELTNCIMRCSCKGRCVVTEETAELLVADCMFREVKYDESNFAKSWGAAMSLKGSGVKTVRRTTFTGCALERDARGVVALASTGAVTFDGCSFLTNSATITKAGYPHSAGICCCQEQSGRVQVRNTAFIGNTIVDSDSSGGYSASAIASNNSIGIALVNCTFEGNSATGNTRTGGTITSWRELLMGIANCVFANNECLSNGTRAPELKNCGTVNPSSGGAGLMILNSIFWNDAEDYIAFDPSNSDLNARRQGFGYSDIKGYAPPTSAPANDGFFYQPLLSATDPKLADRPSTSTTGAMALGLTAESPNDLRRHGVPIYLAKNEQFYFLDTKKNPKVWRRVANVGAEYVAFEDGAAIGLDANADPYPDAFGAARKVGAYPMGPLNPPVKGLMIRIN